jgi:hypothetical protein
MNEVSLREYLEAILKSEEETRKKAEEAILIRIEHTDKRLSVLENASSFSAGKMWMVMLGFAIVPTIIALIALFVR